jgi:NhaP-type Na+/H+ or K+/H+ antiporter
VTLLDAAPFVFALAMLVGVVAQVLGDHLRLPGIVVLLGAGVALGPDGAGVIRPAVLGSAADAIIGFAVAIILFEGGMRLEISRVRKQAKVIRRLVFGGAVLTAIGASLACWAVMHWDVRRSILFGTLVMVTGPTVVGPLVRRIRLAPSLATILEAEGVFIDVVGATVAIMALEVALSPTTGTLGEAVFHVARRLGVGVAIGAAGGLAIAALLRVPRIIPRGMEKAFALAAAVTIYELAHNSVSDSGLAAAMTAGLVVGNMRVHRMNELAEFKEQLTTLLIGTLFVLLAADVRIADVAALGKPALVVVALLMFVVRPLEVFACTVRAGMGWREKLYMSWIAPRGIVAAAVASLFAEHLREAGIPGGTEMRALVFTVIAVTVTLQGLSAGPLAALLGLRRSVARGYAILGANPLARHIASRLVEAGEPVELIEQDADDARAAQEAGLKVIFGSELEPRTLARAQIDARSYAVALTPNQGINLLFARHVADELPGPCVLASFDPDGANPEVVRDRGVRTLFANPVALSSWIARWRRGHVEIVRRVFAGSAPDMPFPPAPPDLILPLLVDRGGSLSLVDERTRLSAGDVVEVAIVADRRAEADAYFASGPWHAEAELAA